jgi:outer membrane protein
MKRPTQMNMRILVALLLTLAAVANTQAQQVLTLNDAIQKALVKNFSLEVARNDEEIARIQNNWGNAGRLPTVSAQAGYNVSNNNLDQRLANGTTIKRGAVLFQNENVSVSGQWRVFNGFRVLAAKNRLEEQETISNIAVRQQANLVVYDVITAYLNLLRFEAQLNATNESLLLFEERMKLAENRFNIGVSAKSDYLQAVTDYNQAKNLIIQTENNIYQVKVAINNLLARDPMTEFTSSTSVAEVQFQDKNAILAAIDTLNPSLLIARSQLLVLAQQHREINAQRLPTLSLSAGAAFNNSNNAAGFTLRNTTFGPNASVQLAVPIFQGNVIKQNLRVNQVLQKSQQVQINIIKNNLMSDLATAYNNFKNAQRRYDLATENLKVVQENNVIAMERFRKASITAVELRQVQINMVEAQVAQINARYEMKQAEADVLLVMGKLVE